MRFWRNERGAAAVEFGLVAPILVFALITTGTMGGMVLAHNKMRQAVSSGAQYALVVSDDIEEIEDVVELAWDGMPADGTVTVAQACYCAGVVSSCTNDCNPDPNIDGDIPQRITTITARRNYDNLAGISTQISASQDVRTR